MDRLVSSSPHSQQPQQGSTGQLKTFDSYRQVWGTFLNGFEWDLFGTGTFRSRTSTRQALARVRRLFDQTGPAAFFAAIERRPSGCGYHAIPIHVHFVAAVAPWRARTICDVAGAWWTQRYGNAKVERFRRELPGAFYLAKLAGHPSGEFIFHNLERMGSGGSMDLLAAIATSAYVPDHAKRLPFVQTLAVRP